VVREYVEFRISVAGDERRQGLFDDEAVLEVGRKSHGIPRLINLLCDRSLLIAYARGVDRVNGSHVREAAEELEVGATLPGPAQQVRAFGSEG
jgi:general secretion pathway protein A